jgi:hypothetical protein
LAELSVLPFCGREILAYFPKHPSLGIWVGTLAVCPRYSVGFGFKSEIPKQRFMEGTYSRPLGYACCGGQHYLEMDF